MQDVDAIGEPKRVDGTIRIAGMVLNNLQNGRAAKSFQRLGISVLSAALREIECIANRIFYFLWKGSEVSSGAPIQTTGLMIGVVIFHVKRDLAGHGKQFGVKAIW